MTTRLPADLAGALAMSRIQELRCQADRYRLTARVRRVRHRREPAAAHPRHTGE